MVGVTVTLSLVPKMIDGQKRIFLKDLDLTKQMAQDEIDAFTDDWIDCERDFTCEVEVNGSYSKGTPNYFDKNHGNWLPGDPEGVEDVTVKFGTIDITNSLSKADLKTCEASLCEFASDDLDFDNEPEEDFPELASEKE